jgi:hypothetical protein
MIDPANRASLGNRSGLRAVPPGSRQIPAQFLNSIGRAIDQARIVPGNAFAHYETPGGTYLEPTEGGREYLHPFYVQYLGDKPGNANKGYISIIEGRILGRADGERGQWNRPDTRHDPAQEQFQNSLGIHGLWASIPDNGLPVDDRFIDDLSIIKIGAGIKRADSIINNDFLVQSNAPIYEIEINPGTTAEGEETEEEETEGEEEEETPTPWRLLFIKAINRDNDEPPRGWVFELTNLPYEEVLKFYDETAPEYDPPRIVDANYNPIRGDTEAMPVTYDPVLYSGVGNHPEEMDGWREEDQTVFSITGPAVEDPILGGVKPLVFKYKYRYTLHRLVEVGTYVLPICYFRTTSKGLEIQQIARSDFHFFPVPRIHTWSKWAEPFALEFGDTELPPEPTEEPPPEPPEEPPPE